MPTITVANLKQSKNGIRCDRSSILGNPFAMRNESEREAVVQAFRKYLYLVAMTWEDPGFAAEEIAAQTGLLLAKKWKRPTHQQVMDELTRIERKAMLEPVTLLCWCAPLGCHCDVVKSYLAYCAMEKLKRVADTKTC